MYFLLFELFATSRPPPAVKQKRPQVSLQPLLSIPKVLQEQQTQHKHITFPRPTLGNYSRCGEHYEIYFNVLGERAIFEAVGNIVQAGSQNRVLISMP